MKEYDIKEIQELMKSGELTSVSLTQLYLDRIESIDKNGPMLNSIIQLNPDALSIAKELDEERKISGSRGLMHGIPVLIKDNIDTGDKMMTTAGSLALEGSYAKEDAFFIKQLRKSGGVILGKTNLSEWANFRGQRSTSGWSSRGGQTKNPYALDRNPCGSSSGSGVAVAANLCSVAVGTETDGSVICPAQTNGIVGIKPTIGLISQSGIIPIAHTQDTAGPMARTVTDAAILLGAMVRSDLQDNVTASSIKLDNQEYTQFLDETGLNQARIGVLRKNFGFNPKVDKIINNSINSIKDAGTELIDPVEIEPPEGLRASEFNVLLYEFKHDLDIYLSKLDDNSIVHSLNDIIDFNLQNSNRVMPHFGQEHMIDAQEKGGLNDEEYLKAIKLYEGYRVKFNEVFEEHNLDAVIAPSGNPSWFTDHINGDHVGGGGSSSIAAITGFSSITVPAGYVNSLPVGLSFIGRAFAEPILIKLAYSFEQKTKIRKPPTFPQHASK